MVCFQLPSEVNVFMQFRRGKSEEEEMDTDVLFTDNCIVGVSVNVRLGQATRLGMDETHSADSGSQT